MVSSMTSNRYIEETMKMPILIPKAEDIEDGIVNGKNVHSVTLFGFKNQSHVKTDSSKMDIRNFFFFFSF